MAEENSKLPTDDELLWLDLWYPDDIILVDQFISKNKKYLKQVSHQKIAYIAFWLRSFHVQFIQDRELRKTVDPNSLLTTFRKNLTTLLGDLDRIIASDFVNKSFTDSLSDCIRSISTTKMYRLYNPDEKRYEFQRAGSPSDRPLPNTKIHTIKEALAKQKSIDNLLLFEEFLNAALVAARNAKSEPFDKPVTKYKIREVVVNILQNLDKVLKPHWKIANEKNFLTQRSSIYATLFHEFEIKPSENEVYDASRIYDLISKSTPG